MATLRVLHCLYDDPDNPWVAGGGAVRAREIYRRLAADVDVEIVTGRYPGSRDGVVDGVRYRRVGPSRPYALSRAGYAVEATRLLGRGGYDVGICDFSVYAPVRVPARPAPVGLVVHHLTGPTARERWGRTVGGGVAALERALLRRAHWISTPSVYTIEALRPIVAPGTHLVNVGAGVDEAFFELDRSDEGYLLYFGRLDLFQKGLDTLLEAFARLAAGRPAVELRVAGRGRDAAAAAALAAELGVSERVRMLGPVSDAERLRLFAGATLLVMPSRFEGFGLVAAEALAAGLPVVAAEAGALPEVLGSGGGVLVPPGDAAALARAVARLLDDAEERRRLSREARESARRFAWGDVARRHLEFLHDIAADAGRARSGE